MRGCCSASDFPFSSSSSAAGGGGIGVLGVPTAAPFQAEQPPLMTSRVNTAVFQRQKQGMTMLEMGL